MRRPVLVLVLAAIASTFVLAQSDRLDYQTIGRIRDEGLNRSQVMDHVSWLSDVYGPRLTGSPAIQQASEWAMKTFTGWGLANIHQERFAFGIDQDVAQYGLIGDDRGLIRIGGVVERDHGIVIVAGATARQRCRQQDGGHAGGPSSDCDA